MPTGREPSGSIGAPSVFACVVGTDDTSTSQMHGDGGEPSHVEFYWRPGCMFCASLRRSLRRRAIPLHRHNIWTDPAAAAVVRSAAAGNETVPTVVVGAATLVNPTPRAVEELLGEVAPHLLEQAAEARESRGGSWFSRWRVSG